MIQEFKLLFIKFLCLLITAPLFAYSLLYVIEKLESAWKEKNRKKKFWALTMLVIFMGVYFGWLR